MSSLFPGYLPFSLHNIYFWKGEHLCQQIIFPLDYEIIPFQWNVKDVQYF